MARIGAAELERIKREVDLAELVRGSGVELKKRGKDLVGCCPFHDDKTPSLVITVDKNLWHCLGACQVGGSVVDWVMKSQHLTFVKAVEYLAKPKGTVQPKVPMTTEPVQPSTAEVTAPPQNQDLMDSVANFYHQTLKETPAAMAYIQRRGLFSSEMVDKFKLGYASRALTKKLPGNMDNQVRTQLMQLGILRTSGHEHLLGCVTIPIIDENGHVQGMYGRRVSYLNKEEVPHLYLAGPHRGVWNVDALKANQTVILCEALIDALTFWCAGFRNVTTSYGVEGFTEDHLAAFKKYGTQEVLIAYDRDDAGDKAATKLAQRLTGEGLRCSRLLFPKGMDANEYARKVLPPEKSLAMVISKAVPMEGAVATEATESGAKPAAKEEQEPDPEPAVETQVVAHAMGIDSAVPPPVSTETVVADQVVEPPAVPIVSEASAPAPVPPTTQDGLPVELNGDEVSVQLGDRKYRVRGLQKNMSGEVLKVNVLVGRGEAVFVDTLDLNQARPRMIFLRQAAAELMVQEDVIKRDFSKLYAALSKLQDDLISKTLEPKPKIPEMTSEEKAAAMAFLEDPALLDRVLLDFETCGIVGEETNKLVGYLAAVSRKTRAPLAIMVQSSSAAGKSSLMDSILSFMPDEERVKYSAMTGQALYYMGETELKHKILALVEEEGADRASYALKLLQSEGELTIASTGKDGNTGRLETKEYHVEGPVMLFVTTTAVELDEELLNRCIVLTVDESRDQTRAIHHLQRERRTLDGLFANGKRSDILKLHQNAQRLLRPLKVANNLARRLTFIDDKTRTRRDHEKYLSLIEAVALLRQYQRPLKTETRDGQTVEYIEVTSDDVETANKLASEIIGRSLDELMPQDRKLLLMLDEMVTQGCEREGADRTEYRFLRRDIRAYTGWSETQTRRHLEHLVQLEYVLVHRGTRGQSFVYELLYDGAGQEGQRFLMGARSHGKSGASIPSPKFGGFPSKFGGLSDKFATPSPPHRRGVSTPSPPPENGKKHNGHNGLHNLDENLRGKNGTDLTAAIQSYVSTNTKGAA